MRVSIYTDGACKGNPGVSGAGAVLKFQDGKVTKLAKGLGQGTNNIAEYEAVLMGMEAAIEAGGTHLRVYTDSELVVRQLTGAYQVKSPTLMALWGKVLRVKAKAAFCEFAHVFREENSDADSLANQGCKLPRGAMRATE